MHHHCLFGHHWDGCRCQRCGQLRDAQHPWDGCRCPQCGLIREVQHDWAIVDCREECRRCGHLGAEVHDWQGCACARCGKPTPHATAHDHNWDGCICLRCGATRHQWANSVCRLCGEHCLHAARELTSDQRDRPDDSAVDLGTLRCRDCGAILSRSVSDC